MRCVLLLTAALLLPLVASGCGEVPEAQYSLSDDTLKLISEARSGMRITVEQADGSSERVELDGVENWLFNLFGTPESPVAWQRLPIDYGGVAGEVAAVTEGDPSSFTATFTDPPLEVEPGTFLQWVTPGDDLIVSTVSEWDPVSQVLSLTAELDSPPEAGTQFVLQPADQLAFGRKLYMTHCMHCHGVAGDGNGPTAKYLNPRPRDYRQGIFKFTSLKQKVRASRDDLRRVIQYGIPGTYMPSFMLLSEKEFSAIVEYVRFLSMRGEMEKAMTGLLAGDYSREAVADVKGEERDEMLAALAEYLGGGFREELSEEATVLAESWQEVEEPDAAIQPTVARVEDSAESRLRGRALYLGKKLDCKGCHGVTGEGNGPQTIAYQEIPGSQPAQKYPAPGLYDAWNQPIMPRDLTQGIYRGGRRPLDLYRRVHSGVKGTPMAGFANALTEKDIWDVVNYVMSIPFEGQQPAAEVSDSEQVASGKTQHGTSGSDR